MFKIACIALVAKCRTKPNLSLYSPYYAEAFNELAMPIFAS